MTNAKVAAILAARSLKDLIRDFEITEDMRDENTPTVRGWLMDELERRNPEAFELWLDEGYDQSPRNFFLK